MYNKNNVLFKETNNITVRYKKTFHYQKSALVFSFRENPKSESGKNPNQFHIKSALRRWKYIGHILRIDSEYNN